MGLTSRERDILMHIIQGGFNEQITMHMGFTMHGSLTVTR